MMSDFRVYADEPSIIYEFSMTGCPPGILLDDLGETCIMWLREEYPKCTFVYESESCTLFLDGGHGLSEELIRRIQVQATAFVLGLMYGAEMVRGPKRDAPFRHGRR